MNIPDSSDNGVFISDISPSDVDQYSLLQRRPAGAACVCNASSGSATFSLQHSRARPLSRPRVSDVLGSTLQM